jgi:MFS family permease
VRWAALCIPALIALSRVRGDEIDYARARNADKGERARNYHRIFDIGKNRNLYVFAACVFFFSSPTPRCCRSLERIWRRARRNRHHLLMASLIVVPQVLMAILSPWVGYHSEKWGRKPLLLLGFGLETARAILFSFSTSVPVLLVAQLLGGMSAAAVIVLTVLIITDMTTGTGRFNLVHGFVGTLQHVPTAMNRDSQDTPEVRV